MFTVCVRCFTYNHARYIRNSMDGFVRQETHFPFVAIIVDDASTDDTAHIISDYFNCNFDTKEQSIAYQEKKEYGTVLFARHLINTNCFFAVILLKENHYSQRKSKGSYYGYWINDSKYIAICEGDDYWVDSLKLQKQADILDKNPELMAVVTNSMVVDTEGKTLSNRMARIVPENREGRYSLHDYLKNVHHYPTAAVLYRNNHRLEVQRMMRHTKNKYLGDWTLWAILHSFGDFYYLDDVTSAYRINPTSLTHTVDRVGRAKANLTICQSLSEVLPPEYSPYLKKAGWMYFSVFMAYRKEKKLLRMVSSLSVCFIKYPVYTIKRLIHLAQGTGN